MQGGTTKIVQIRIKGNRLQMLPRLNANAMQTKDDKKIPRRPAGPGGLSNPFWSFATPGFVANIMGAFSAGFKD